MSLKKLIDIVNLFFSLLWTLSLMHSVIRLLSGTSCLRDLSYPLLIFVTYVNRSSKCKDMLRLIFLVILFYPLKDLLQDLILARNRTNRMRSLLSCPLPSGWGLLLNSFDLLRKYGGLITVCSFGIVFWWYLHHLLHDAASWVLSYMVVSTWYLQKLRLKAESLLVFDLFGFSWTAYIRGCSTTKMRPF